MSIDTSKEMRDQSSAREKGKVMAAAEAMRAIETAQNIINSSLNENQSDRIHSQTLAMVGLLSALLLEMVELRRELAEARNR
ncbi:MAG: hypothetical protein ACK40O_06110 [Allosphingosinicella sp.]